MTRSIPALPPLIEGVGAIADAYDCFILDVWGVLHNGVAPFPGTVDCLRRLMAGGKQILLLSNTPNRNAPVRGMLAAMGITPDLYHHLVTAGDSAHDDLKANYGGKACWYAGDSYAGSLTAGLDLTLLPHHDGADFIINAIHGITGDARADFLRDLERAREKGLHMVCANPDMVVQVGADIKECPGTFAQYYEQIGGTVTYHGKPHLPIYRMAHALLGEPDKRRIVAIGDSFHTDISGANNFGIDSVFNMAGIHGEELDTLEKRVAVFASQAARPTYLMRVLAY